MVSFSNLKAIFKASPSNVGTELGRVISTPKATGLGVFSEPISFQVLGNSMDLLNIKLPQSSILNIRYNNNKHNVVAVNGDSKWEVSLVRSNNGLIYQRCFNPKAAMSILMSSNGAKQGSSYVVLGNGRWSVRRDSLLAWSHGVQLEQLKDNKLFSVNTDSSTDRVVISSPGQVTQIGLSEGETISLNSECLVAFSGEQKKLEVENKSNLSIGVIPRGMRFRKMLQPLAKYIPENVFKSVEDFNSLQWVKTIKLMTSKSFKAILNLAKKVKPVKSQLITLKGPQTVFITNNLCIKDPLFVEREINELVK